MLLTEACTAITMTARCAASLRETKVSKVRHKSYKRTHELYLFECTFSQWRVTDDFVRKKKNNSSSRARYYGPYDRSVSVFLLPPLTCVIPTFVTVPRSLPTAFSPRSTHSVKVVATDRTLHVHTPDTSHDETKKPWGATITTSICPSKVIERGLHDDQWRNPWRSKKGRSWFRLVLRRSCSYFTSVLIGMSFK